MSDGARCFYCRKVPCQCANAVEDPQTQVERLKKALEELANPANAARLNTSYSTRRFIHEALASILAATPAPAPASPEIDREARAIVAWFDYVCANNEFIEFHSGDREPAVVVAGRDLRKKVLDTWGTPAGEAPASLPCSICGKEKGQPPERCNGHYEMPRVPESAPAQHVTDTVHLDAEGNSPYIQRMVPVSDAESNITEGPHSYKFEYTVALQKDEDSDIVARALELPGCMAHGSTVDEALSRLAEIQAMWLESAAEDNEPLPTKMSGDAFMDLNRTRKAKTHGSFGIGCRDCGAPYGSDGWVDVVIPHEVWNALAPFTAGGSGLLCFRCMTKRLEAKGYGPSNPVPVIVASGPYEDANDKWRLVGLEHGRAEGKAEGREWQPITTDTPRTPILVSRFRDKYIYTPTTAFLDATDVWRVYRSEGGNTPLPFVPTCWMPLPEPPKESA